MLLCAVQFLDIADAAIVNVALPSIQHSLGFSQQNLQWVASGYILTYGGYRALLADSILMAAAALLALRVGNTRKAAPLVTVSTEPARRGRAGTGPRTDASAQQRLHPDK